MQVMKVKSQPFIWNTIGNTANALLSLILLVVVNWSNGPNDGGLFSFAFSNAFVFYTIGIFSVRTYQVTDVKNIHKTEHYLGLRFLTCAAMVVLLIGYAMISGGSAYRKSVIILLGLLKGVDALSDVYQGLLQVHDRLDIAGKGLFYRTTSSAASFAAVIILSHSLLLASLFAVLTNFTVFLCYDVRQSAKYDTVLPKFIYRYIRPVFIACLPLFLSNLLWNYVFNAPKYTIEACLNNEAQNIFGIISMPAASINLVGIFIFYPILVGFAKKYANNEKLAFVRIIFILIAVLGAVTVAAEAVTYYIGVPFLNFIYHIDIAAYKKDLLILMLTGGFGACSSIFNSVLTIMRKQGLLLLGNILATGVAYVSSLLFIRHYGLHGACYANFITVLSLFLILAAITFISIVFFWGSKAMLKDRRSLNAPCDR